MSGEELPEGWCTAPIKDLCTLINGRAFKPHEWGTEGLPIVRIQNLNDPNKPFNHFSGEVDARFYIDPEELLFAWSGTPGTSFGAHIWQGGRAILNQHIFRVLPRAEVVEKRFLRFAINERIEHLIGQAHGGAGLAHVTKPVFEATGLHVPPLNEQRRIVAKLEDLLARSRRAKDVLDAIPPLLEKLRQSILAAAFRGDLTADWRAQHPDVEPASELLKRIRVERRKKWEEAELAKLKAKGKAPTDDRWKAKYQEPAPVDESELPELPEGWCWASVEELSPNDAPVVYGIILPGEDIPDGVPYIRPIDIRDDGTVNMASLKRTSPETATQYGRAALQTGDIVLSIVGTIGKVAIVPTHLNGANITQSSVRIRPPSGMAPEFFANALKSPQLQAQFSKYRFGNAVQRLNVEHARLLAIPLPPLEEQRALNKRVTSAMRLVPAALLNQLRDASASMDAALLAKAFRGELVPQDPSDEPAAAMLERLAAERANTTPTTAAGSAKSPKRSKRAR